MYGRIAIFHGIQLTYVPLIGWKINLSAERAGNRFTSLRWKDARVNKPLFQAHETLPVVFLVMLPACCSANRSTFSRRNSKSSNLYSKCQKFDAITREPCSYYDSACPKMTSEHLISKNFLVKHAPRPL